MLVSFTPQKYAILKEPAQIMFFLLSGLLLPNMFLMCANSCTSSICDELRAVLCARVCVNAETRFESACVHMNVSTCVFLWDCHVICTLSHVTLPCCRFYGLSICYEVTRLMGKRDSGRDGEKQGEPMDWPVQMKTGHRVVRNKVKTSNQPECNKYMNITSQRIFRNSFS